AGIVEPGTPRLALFGGAMLARSRGAVRVRSADPRELPAIDPAYLSDPERLDRRVLEHAGQLIRAVASDPGFARLVGPEVSQPQAMMDTIVSYGHPLGTCRMGSADDSQAVVDPLGRVYGVSRLYVADASIMPTNIRGNINLPVAMIAANVLAKLHTG